MRPLANPSVGSAYVPLWAGFCQAVDTVSFGGNISDSTSITTVNFSGRTGPAFDMFTDADLTNSNFDGSLGDLFDFNDGTTNIVANNFGVEIQYDDLSGNIGGTFVPSDPAVFVP